METLVIVPARPGADGPEMETRQAIGGPGLMLPVFSSVSELVRRLGHQQPWICVPLRDARAVALVAGLAGVVIDPEGMP